MTKENLLCSEWCLEVLSIRLFENKKKKKRKKNKKTRNRNDKKRKFVNIVGIVIFVIS